MSVNTAVNGVSPPRTTTFVADEICIAIETDPGHAGMVYQSVQVFLNAKTIAGGNLNDLNRRDGRWIVSLNERLTLLFYRLEPGDGDLDVRNENILRLVLTINRNFSGQSAGRSDQDGWQIIAASPNWIGTASQPQGDVDSPAAPPKAAAHPKQFRFYRGDQSRGSAELQDLVQNQRREAEEGARSDVVVAILDTCPPPNVVQAAANHFGGSLWQQMVGGANPVSIDGPLFLNLNVPGGAWSEILPSWLGRLDAWYTSLDPTGRVDLNVLANLRATTYAMPDHGLFSAGIVKDIAPKTEIHLIQAIDDAGLTDLLEVTDALSVLPGTLGGKKRLIVNLSLTFTVPTFAEFLKQGGPLLAGLTQDDYDLIHHSLGDVMAWLQQQNVLVVASAGNYNMPDAARPEPRFPAYYDTVFGVAAYNRQFAAAAYSNCGDENKIVVSNGIATLGGDTIINRGQREIADLRDGPDAIEGIFSAVDLPFFPLSAAGTTVGNGSNTTGWVYWVGTSFAAPIISAVAAAIWDRDPALSPAELIEKVQGFADPAITQQEDLHCDAIWADQV